jgi:hypothetical protein
MNAGTARRYLPLRWIFTSGRIRSQGYELCKLIILLTLPLFLTLSRVACAEWSESNSNGEPPSLMNTAQAHDEGPGMMGPLVGIDVSPGNGVTPFAPHWVRTPEGRTLGSGFGIDKMLSQNWDIEIDSTYDSYGPKEGARESGLGTVDLLSRMLFLNQPDMQAGVAPQLSFGLGTLGQSAGVDNAGVALLWGARGGALPESWNLSYFRAIEVHSDLGYSRILKDGSGDEIYFDPVIDYSFPYMQ